MRIGMLSGEYPPQRGGVGDYTRWLARHLSQLGLEIHILTSQSGGAGEAEESPNLRVYRRIRRWGLSALLATRRWALAQRLDLLHLQFQTAAFAMSPWVQAFPKALRGWPTITTFHDLRAPYLFPKAGPLRKASVLWLARSSAGVIVTGVGDRSRLPALAHIAEIPVGSNIFAPLPNTFNREETRTRYEAKRSDFVIAHFGFQHASKGLSTLLEALAALREEDGDSCPRLWLVGAPSGPSDPSGQRERARLRRQSASLGLGNIIHETGDLAEAEVHAALVAADLVVLPYREGAAHHHGSLQAAIHAGCAILTTKPQSTTPLFRDGENLRFVQPEDPQALATAIRQLQKAPLTRARLRSGAAQLAREFAWPRIATLHEHFYREVLESLG